MYVMFYVFSFPPYVYGGTLTLISSIPGPFVLALHSRGVQKVRGKVLPNL